MNNLDVAVINIQNKVRQNPEDPKLGAELIRLLMRKGDIPPRKIKTLARLGDPASLLLFPQKAISLNTERFLYLNPKKISVEFAIYCALKVLKEWDEYYPEDNRPRLAIEAAQNWLNNPNATNSQRAIDAGRQATEASEETDTLHWNASSAALSAFTAGSGSNRKSSQYANYAAEDAAQALLGKDKKYKSSRILLIEFLSESILA